MPLAAADAGWLQVTPYSGWGFPAQSYGLANESFQTVRSQQEWDELLPQLGARPSQGNIHAPEVDFEKLTMLVAALGTRPSGGFAVLIEGAFDDGRMIEVYVLELRPGPHCAVTTGITHPVAIALIPRRDRPVRFHIDTADVNCEATRSAPDSRLSNKRSRGP
jgi:hypothetical protein